MQLEKRISNKILEGRRKQGPLFAIDVILCLEKRTLIGKLLGIGKIIQ